MSNVDDLSENCTPPEIKEGAENVSEKLLPVKSKDFYIKIYGEFKDWCQSKGVTTVSENVLLVYFQEKAQNRKASSLWALFSMLKSTLRLKENIDVATYFKVIAFLKRQNESYTPKKAGVFEKNHVTTFIREAPDDIFLSAKVVLIVGVAGVCRTDELCNMKVSDFDVRDDIIIVNIPNTKNGSSRKFVIIEPLWINAVKKYLSKRPTPDMEKVFIGFRSGKPVKQNMGHNTISAIPKKIATYLKLSNMDSYSGHSLRRTSATILADNGGDILSLKRHGGWKSSAVAEGYVENSIADKKRIAGMVQGTPIDKPLPTTSSVENEVIGSSSSHYNSQANIPVENMNAINSCKFGINMTCNNCTINYYFK